MAPCYFIFFYLFGLVSFANTNTLSQPLSVLIDAGHGGHDRGAVFGNIRESEIVIAVAEELFQELKKDPALKPLMTRVGDQFLSLDERVATANRQKVDLFVSIHANAAHDRRARGVEFYFQNQLLAKDESHNLALIENMDTNDNDTDSNSASDAAPRSNEIAQITADLKNQARLQNSLRLSKALAAEWASTHRVTRQTVKQAPFRVVSRTKMPSVLIELGFLTHASDARKLIDPVYQKAIAKKIHLGITRYRQQLDRSDANAQEAIMR